MSVALENLRIENIRELCDPLADCVTRSLKIEIIFYGKFLFQREQASKDIRS
jgi:hypothetical protein